MVREIVRFVLCDICSEGGKRTEADTVTIRIEDNAGELDLCEAHRRSLLTDLVAALSVHAKPVGDVKPQRAPQRPSQARVRPTGQTDHGGRRCPVCERDYSYSYMDSHLSADHQTTAEEITGRKCAIDGFTAVSLLGLTTHIQKRHGAGVLWVGALEKGAELGDPYGVVAEAQKRIKVIRERQSVDA